MYSFTVSMLMDVVSDGKIILCFCEEFLKMEISIEISFSAQQCCGGLSSKQLGCYNACHAVGSTVHIVKSDQLLDSVIKVPLKFFLKFDDRDHVALQNTDSLFCISITVSWSRELMVSTALDL
ncbi:hypothetical protein NC651_021281 [Populus alba x Populus x berolinensis]|nr:hypothetical protein NC651_021281 [Populus alba x Populus x berolinensis]